MTTPKIQKLVLASNPFRGVEIPSLVVEHKKGWFTFRSYIGDTENDNTLTIPRSQAKMLREWLSEILEVS